MSTFTISSADLERIGNLLGLATLQVGADKGASPELVGRMITDLTMAASVLCHLSGCDPNNQLELTAMARSVALPVAAALGAVEEGVTVVTPQQQNLFGKGQETKKDERSN